MSRSEFSASDYKTFPGVGRGAYHAHVKAIAKGWKKSFTGGSAKGYIHRVGLHVIAHSSSHSISMAE